VGENLDDHGGIFNGRDEGQGGLGMSIDLIIQKEKGVTLW